VAGLAWRAGSLTLGGAAAAGLVGTLVLGGAGWSGGAVLAAFFIPSTLVSRAARAPEVLDPKGDRRDTRQVLANGGVAALAALLGLRWPGLAHWLLTVVLAAAAADTWATALGSRSSSPPRLLGSGQPVPRGTNGGVTLLGCLGALAGALLVGGIGVVAGGPAALLPTAALIGFAGMLADAGLGAGLQARFQCSICGVPSEWPTHRCGAPTTFRGGIRWLDNDVVNLAATGIAAGLGAVAWLWCGPFC
jgi:uncharacterized protein (TIGR00297 family)